MNLNYQKIVVVLCPLILFSLLSIAQAPPVAWTQYWNASQAVIGFEVKVDNQSNILFSGTYRTTLDLDPGTGTDSHTAVGTFNCFFVKLDEDGNYIWGKVFDSEMTITTILVDDEDDIIISGRFQNTIDFDSGPDVVNLISNGLTDSFVAKYHTDGTFVWAKSFGAAQFDDINGMSLDDTGNIYVAGKFNETVDFDPGNNVTELTAEFEDGFFSKFDGDGNFIWAIRLGGSSTNDVIGIEVNSIGDIFVMGQYIGAITFNPEGVPVVFDSPTSGMFAAKYDSNGQFVWAREIHGMSNINLYATTIDVQSAIYMTGYFSGTGDFDPGANTTELAGDSSGDLFLLKLNDSGDLEFVLQLGNIDGPDYCGDVVVDPLMNIYLTGYYTNTVDFDNSGFTFELTSSGALDAFVMKLDDEGNYVWATSFGSNQSDFGRAVAINSTGSVYVTGSRLPSGDSPHSYAYLTKYEGQSIGTMNHSDSNAGIAVFPNPARDRMTILSNDQVSNYIISDLSGRVLMDVKTNSKSLDLHLDKLPVGIFSLSVHSGENVLRTRIVKE